MPSLSHDDTDPPPSRMGVEFVSQVATEERFPIMGLSRFVVSQGARSNNALSSLERSTPNKDIFIIVQMILCHFAHTPSKERLSVNEKMEFFASIA
mmetsp:Transcript_88956/g.139352  ORF Transcript_88956/g.139352 Transcript_88956/m.139352 type:complete len:96 (-) Transcript_88956:62-349(-)